MPRRNLRSLLSVAALVVMSSVLRAGDLDLGILPQIGKVDALDKVGEFKFDKDPVDKRLAAMDYIVCYNWNLVKEPAWRCTKQPAQLQEARDFSNYQNSRYLAGQSFFVGVRKDEWGNDDSRKVIMDRVRRQAIPAVLERAARKEESTNLDLAAALRKQIQFVKPEWVDVKPVLSKDSKEYKDLTAGTVQASQAIGYDDNATKTDVTAALTANPWRRDGKTSSGFGWRINVLKFSPNNRVVELFDFDDSGVQVNQQQLDYRYRDLFRKKPFRSGTWTIRGDGKIVVDLRDAGINENTKEGYYYKIIDGDLIEYIYNDNTKSRYVKGN